MTGLLYGRLSLMQFLEFAIWGAWAPVLAARLFGPLKMSGKQVGWIYGTLYLGFIISPLIAGQIADRWVATEFYLAAAHLIGGFLLLLAARQKSFGPLFAAMFVYALSFGPTVALVNSLMFQHMKGFESQSFGVMVWGTIGWVLVGWFLSLYRGKKGAGEGNDCLVLAGLLSLVMAAYCLTLPHTPPQGKPGEALPFIKALSMLQQPAFLVFIIVSFVLASQLMFYYQGTAPFLGDLGVQAKNIPAAMTIAQIAEAVAAAVIVFRGDSILGAVGFRGVFAVGAAMWLALYLFYALGKPRSVVVASQALHGIAYNCFVRLGFLYVDTVASKDFKSSAQALFIVVMFGIGMFVGSQFTGAVMDKFQINGKFRWRTLFLVPCALTALCVILLLALFRG